MVIWPDERLHDPVSPFPEEHLGSKLVRNTAGAMIRSMYKHYGVGLAAPQAGVPFQIFVMDAYWTQEGNKKKPRVFLNPKITGVGEYVTELPHPGEGCLSFPYDHRAPVQRHDRVELEWLDFKGNTHHQWFDGYESIVIQHEFDHLLGFCYIDRLSPLKKDMALRRARKMRRAYRNGMRGTVKMFKKMQNGPEAVVNRNKRFEAGTPQAKLRRAAKKHKEGIENGTITTDIPSGDSEVVDTRPSSRVSEEARGLVQREDARGDSQRVQLPVSDQDQEGDERAS